MGTPSAPEAATSRDPGSRPSPAPPGPRDRRPCAIPPARARSAPTGSHHRADGPGHELVVAEAERLALARLAGGGGEDDVEDPLSHLLHAGLAVDDQAVYLTSDFFGPDKYLVYMVDKADVMAGNAPATTSVVINGQHSIGVAVNPDGAPYQFMLQAFETFSSSSVRLWAVQDPLGTPTLLAYGASKHAVVGMTRTAGFELAAHNIRVNAICPGVVDTRMMRSIET